ncbi:MAG: prefoldin subunit [Candidatus Thorarchaeota archaeon]
MAQKLPPALEQELERYEGLRRENETLQLTIQALQSELSELSMTLEQLRKQPDDTVTYKIVGSVMFRVPKPKLVEELEDREKTLQMRVSSYSRKLESSSQKLKELQEKIQIELGKHNLRLQ